MKLSHPDGLMSCGGGAALGMVPAALAVRGLLAPVGGRPEWICGRMAPKSARRGLASQLGTGRQSKLRRFPLTQRTDRFVALRFVL